MSPSLNTATWSHVFANPNVLRLMLSSQGLEAMNEKIDTFEERIHAWHRQNDTLKKAF